MNNIIESTNVNKYRLAGADPGLILGCCKILQKEFNIEMM